MSTTSKSPRKVLQAAYAVARDARPADDDTPDELLATFDGSAF